MTAVSSADKQPISFAVKGCGPVMFVKMVFKHDMTGIFWFCSQSFLCMCSMSENRRGRSHSRAQANMSLSRKYLTFLQSSVSVFESFTVITPRLTSRHVTSGTHNIRVWLLPNLLLNPVITITDTMTVKETVASCCVNFVFLSCCDTVLGLKVKNWFIKT